MAGKLYVTGTPIGNLSDMTFRAVEVLKNVDFIAAEDTRVSRGLLTHFDIHKPMVSYHKFTTESREGEIIDRILSGENCAIITDAGMPCISDPGEALVKECHRHGIEVESVPGPSAVVTALAISGMDTSRFSFEGFLSVTKKQREEHLLEVRDYKRTLIFYEAPHKLINTLKDMLESFGDRNIALCRELTKIHEEVLRGKISEMLDYYNEKTPKGEYVLVIEGKKEEEKKELTLTEAAVMAKKLVDSGEKVSDACKKIASETEFSKSEIYRTYLDMNS